MSDRTRPVPSLFDDAPESQANKLVETTRKALATMLKRGGGENRAAPSPAVPQHQQITEAVSPSTSGKLIYGDGNTVQEGDLVQDQKTQMLAEVTTVAGNGVVLNIPAVGAKILQPSELLGYKRMGQKKNG